LQQGIAVVLVFIGLKMLAAKWIEEWLDTNQQVFISLGAIITCVTGSIAISIIKNRQKELSKT
jgi:tellurite resistance protein TerC